MQRNLQPYSGLTWILLLLLAFGAATPATASEADDIAEVMQLGPGMTVADVGAGDGEWSVALARHVGETGHVYATEVDPDELRKIRDRMAEEELGNVSAVLGNQETTGLLSGCCDAILLRLVYHHFTDPAKMRANLRRALRPDGLLVVIDTLPQEDWDALEGVPDRGGHGIPPRDLVQELTADGFRVVSRHEEWQGKDDRYCIVFQREPVKR